MLRQHWRALVPLLIPAMFAGMAYAQQALTWEQIRERFRVNNPNLMASRVSIEEAKANEITAGLRPNPELGIVLDQFHVFDLGQFRPFDTAQWTPTVSQLFERRHKRQLRVESARLATSGASTDQLDLERQLTFNLRDAFNRVLQAKSLLEVSEDNMKYYDELIRVNRERFQAGDIARTDLDRIELQRAQFETDLANARVNLRTAKIDMLALLNDRQQAVDSLDITGEFAFKETILIPTELHQIALDARPDLRSAATAIQKARADNRLAWANGSADPILGLEYQRTQPDNTMGVTLQIPLRIFDRNQGEKQRTSLEIRRTEKLREGFVTTAFHDIDSSYTSLDSTRAILRSYRDRYIPQAERVRETVSFAYKNGGASLLDFLDAQKSYRDTQLAYRNLIGGYLMAVNQLNLAVGQEVMQ
ncbi:MAG: TolC family protein [Acidobacteriota bacterium]|nr:TolC family protein [Acidobacteriota bacterium]